MSDKQPVLKPDSLIKPPPPPAPPQRRGPVFPEDMGHVKITTDALPWSSHYLYVREEDTQIGRLRAELLEVCEEMHRRYDLHMKTVRHVRVLKREITRLISKLKRTKGDLAKQIEERRRTKL